MTLRNKRILVTAGPTWVSIDNVRVISNIATGETGILLAEEANKSGAKVTLFLGPVGEKRLSGSIKIYRFLFFDELRNKVIKELENKKYDTIIHSAAVSDFMPQKVIKGKLGSNKVYKLKLLPSPKIIMDIRRIAPNTKTVIFKLESGVSDKILLKRAKAAQIKTGSDFIVANQLNPYHAFIVDKAGNVLPAKNKNELVKKLLKIVN